MDLSRYAQQHYVAKALCIGAAGHRPLLASQFRPAGRVSRIACVTAGGQLARSGEAGADYA
jgi:hypothetical protein